VEDLEQRLRSGEGEMCGGFPVIFTMAVARKLGATHGVLYKSANSGDVTNEKARVVGYAAMGLYKGALTTDERQVLLSLAKKTVDQYVKYGHMPEYTATDKRLAANGATFVTINRNGNLRGCIGNIEPVMPLYRSVIMNAVAACSQDPRFAPMTREELTNLEIEVTVLSPLEALQDIKDIRIGTHGLYIMKGGNAGILLPQVASEYNWNVPTFLEQVSLKAGLPRDAWKTSQLFSFTADIIK
jgi:AmmeMemoRadiSam system protein A